MTSTIASGPLHLDDSELSACVACGLCLPHCPTYRVTGEEGLSPRGRIEAMRAVEWRGAPVDDEFVHFVETCVQCRGCEPACPSGVHFGHLIETTKSALAASGKISPRWQRLGFAALAHSRVLLAGSTVLAVAQRVRLVPRRLGVPRLPVRRGRRHTSTGTGPSVWMLTGCVMDAWMRSTHAAATTLVEATGVTVNWTGPQAGCCGALHIHAGLHDEAVKLARNLLAALPGDEPILVDSAGCGASMKEYGRLLGTPEAAAFAARVRDVHEWLAEHVGELPAARRQLPPVIVQDPCHLRHVQRVQGSVRTVLGHYTTLVELDDDGLCCGAGGAYATFQPDLAASIRERKLAAIERATQRSGATIVASANPGCLVHLRAAGVDARHPMDLIHEALDGGAV